MRDLPEGWTQKRLLDILDYEGGSQPPKKQFIYEPKTGYVRLIQIRDFGDKPFPTYVPDSPRLKKVKANDLLLARYGGSSANDSLGRICTGLKGAYNVALAKLIFDENILDKSYVKFLFMGPWFKAKVSQNSRSCQTGFNRDDLQDIYFPIAPLQEQKLMAQRLEIIFSQTEAIRIRLDKIPALLKRFRQSVLSAACSGRLTADWRDQRSNEQKPTDVEPVAELRFDGLPSSWAETYVGSAISDLRYGTSKKCSYLKTGLPVLRIPNITDGAISHADLKYADFEANEIAKLTLKPGDILIIRSNGSVSLVGKTAIATEGETGFIFAGYLMRLRPKRNLIYPKFLHFALSSAEIRVQIEIPARSTSGVNNINSDEVKKLQFALPPLQEQREIVRRVEKLFKLVDEIENRYKTARESADKLIQSILAKAFRGELVSQDPSSELHASRSKTHA